MSTNIVSPITLYQNIKSGHCHKVSLFMHLIDVPFTTVEPDMASGEHKGDAFLAMNPFGQVPVIQDGGITLSDSNAILSYLASAHTSEPSKWLGETPQEIAAIQRWFSVSAGELARGPAAARLEYVFGATIDVERVLATSASLLTTMERHLAEQNEKYLVSNRLTAADIAMYSYIAHAPEGGVSLVNYPNINAWIGNIQALPGFVAMPSSEIAEARV
ncbi:glutathione S-transferase [Alteromonas sp. KC3]|uniref:glutathione S-transferase family protein n=1 Tax=unclassified Alteromonas TaxID=2614992 RepID=UPI0019207679|nr:MULTISPECIES: glutathione S-transferase [unclassified Alteromonas]BCO18845.1 glutathione S-transferase [Alteromonas sp. KC3]BCO22808.1 glutathione S-transferase [Alteromonas sp. KC14]